MDKSLTVIVPFFNEEKTLRKSVDNLISENVAKSIILVDDKSTDNSLNIAEEFVGKNSNILLLKRSLMKVRVVPFIMLNHISTLLM